MDKEVKELLKKIEEKEKIIKKYEMLLKRFGLLEDQENKKPSEALESLEYLYEVLKWEYLDDNSKKISMYDEKVLNTIKQALLKLDFLEDAMDLPINCFSTFKNRNDDEVTIMRRERYEKYQEQEKVFEIIKEKEVDIVSLKNALSVKQYNSFISFKINYMDYMKLTEEEFNLLKRW